MYFEDVSECGKSDIKKPPHAKQCDLCGLSHRTGRKCDQKTSKGKVYISLLSVSLQLFQYLCMSDVKIIVPYLLLLNDVCLKQKY